MSCLSIHYYMPGSTLPHMSEGTLSHMSEGTLSHMSGGTVSHSSEGALTHIADHLIVLIFFLLLHTIPLQWLKHLLDRGKLFETWVVRATEVNHGAR